MTGDDDKAFQTLMDNHSLACPHWYHMMVGKLLFCYPTIISSDYELLQVAEVIYNLFIVIIVLKFIICILLLTLYGKKSAKYSYN